MPGFGQQAGSKQTATVTLFYQGQSYPNAKVLAGPSGGKDGVPKTIYVEVAGVAHWYEFVEERGSDPHRVITVKKVFVKSSASNQPTTPMPMRVPTPEIIPAPAKPKKP